MSKDTRTREEREQAAINKWCYDYNPLTPEEIALITEETIAESYKKIPIEEKRESNRSWRRFCAETPEREHSKEPPYPEVTDY